MSSKSSRVSPAFLAVRLEKNQSGGYSFRRLSAFAAISGNLWKFGALAKHPFCRADSAWRQEFYHIVFLSCAADETDDVAVISGRGGQIQNKTGLIFEHFRARRFPRTHGFRQQSRRAQTP